MYLFKDTITIKEEERQVPKHVIPVITRGVIDRLLSPFDLPVSEWCRVTGLAYVGSPYFCRLLRGPGEKVGCWWNPQWLAIDLRRRRNDWPLPLGPERMHILTGWSQSSGQLPLPQCCIGTKRRGPWTESQLSAIAYVSWVCYFCREWKEEPFLTPVSDCAPWCPGFVCLFVCFWSNKWINNVNARWDCSCVEHFACVFHFGRAAGDQDLNPKEDTDVQSKMLSLLLRKSLVPVEKNDALGARRSAQDEDYC